MIKLLKKTINGRVEAALAQFFHEHPSGRFFAMQVSRETGFSYAGVHKGLNSLRSKGFLKFHKEGRETYFRLDLGNAAVRAYRVYLNILRLEPLVAALKESCSKVIIYGSASTGTNSEKSDFDVLVVTSDARAALKAAEAIEGERVSIAAKTSASVLELKAKDPAFYENAMLKGIVLYENP